MIVLIHMSASGDSHYSDILKYEHHSGGIQAEVAQPGKARAWSLVLSSLLARGALRLGSSNLPLSAIDDSRVLEDNEGLRLIGSATQKDGVHEYLKFKSR